MNCREGSGKHKFAYGYRRSHQNGSLCLITLHTPPPFYDSTLKDDKENTYRAHFFQFSRFQSLRIIIFIFSRYIYIYIHIYVCVCLRSFISLLHTLASSISYFRFVQLLPPTRNFYRRRKVTKESTNRKSRLQ